MGPRDQKRKVLRKRNSKEFFVFDFVDIMFTTILFFIKEIIGIIIIKNMNNMKCIKKNILIALLTIIISIFMFVFINIQYALVLTMSILFIEYLECI